MSKCLVFLCILSMSVAASAVIFGTDDRAEVSSNPRFARLARATAVMVANQYLSDPHDGRVDLDFMTADDRDSYGLCPDERFAHQRVSPIACTGVLVGPDLLLTAGHCVVNWSRVENQVTPQCEGFAWVFDDVVTADAPQGPQSVPAGNVARCKTVVYANMLVNYDKASDINSFGEDIALIRLDHAFGDRPTLKIATQDRHSVEELTTIGYPLGLPAKITTHGHFLEAIGNFAFRSDTDALGGNSGGPVLNGKDEIVGLLVRAFPDADFRTDKGETCARLNRCDPATKRCDVEDPRYLTGTEVQDSRAILPYLLNAIR